jgi:hypothetical protein
MISSLNPSVSARRMVCAEWQSLQTGTFLSGSPAFAAWMLPRNWSWMP